MRKNKKTKDLNYLIITLICLLLILSIILWVLPILGQNNDMIIILELLYFHNNVENSSLKFL